MNEEIKEILDYIDDRIIPNEKWDKIKDYITNLQEQIKKYHKELTHKTHQYEYIRHHDFSKEIERLHQENKSLKQENTFLKNILQGSDEK